MSHPDSFEDWFCDHEEEALETWLEEGYSWQLFGDWLFNEKQDLIRSNLFKEFLASQSKEYTRFQEDVREDYEARPEPEYGEDR